MSTWAWMSGPIFAVAHAASTNGPAGSGRSASFSTASNTAAGAAPSSGRHARCPATSSRPAGGLGLHPLQRRELPAAPEAVADIRHRPFHPGLVAGLQRPGRVDQAAVMGGELGIGPVELRVVEVGLVDPGLQVVRNQAGRDAAEEGERLDMALDPGPLVHLQHRAGRTCDANTPAPSRTPTPCGPSRHRVHPAAQQPVVDLRLLPGLGGPRARPSPATGGPPPGYSPH